MQARLSLFLAAWIAIPATHASARIERECQDGVDSCTLIFQGEIVRGDAQLFERAIRSSPRPVALVTADSPGGDPFEALAISEVLNRHFVLFTAGFRNPYGERVLDSGGDCASACAIVWLTSDQRGGTEVFIHRPTFPDGMFKAMTAEQAQRAYQTESERLVTEMRARGVPPSEIEAMMDTPSESLQKVDQSYPRQSAWIEEWLRAKCGSETQAIVQWVIDPSSASGTTFRCAADAIMKAQRDTKAK